MEPEFERSVTRWDQAAVTVEWPLVVAVVVSFDPVTWTATVRLPGSESGVFVAAPVSRGLPAAALTAGARCVVWAPGTAASEWVVLAVV